MAKYMHYYFLGSAKSMLFYAMSFLLGRIYILGFQAEERGRASKQNAQFLITHYNDP